MIFVALRLTEPRPAGGSDTTIFAMTPTLHSGPELSGVELEQRTYVLLRGRLSGEEKDQLTRPDTAVAVQGSTGRKACIPGGRFGFLTVTFSLEFMTSASCRTFCGSMFRPLVEPTLGRVLLASCCCPATSFQNLEHTFWKCDLFSVKNSKYNTCVSMWWRLHSRKVS